jgi:cytidylate kinase
VVAIDGPAGAGKSTVARGLSRALGFSYIDTGALYRSVAWLAEQNGVDWQDGARLAELAVPARFEFDSSGELLVDGTAVGAAIRTPAISRGSSVVARQPQVRKGLLAIQRTLGANGGVVLEGRDIGTVVFPDAEVKFFLVASVGVRARRRFDELVAGGSAVTIEQVEREIEERDRADRERSISPLKQATDAVEIDCDELSARQVIDKMKSMIETRFPLTWDTKDNK